MKRFPPLHAATLATVLAMMLAFTTSPVIADGGSSGPDPVPSKIVRLIESEQYDRAIPQLEKFVRNNRKSADGWNWLGYSQRSTGDLDGALRSYEQALKMDRKHLGANEYLGELYVMRGDMVRAQKQLDKLVQYCGDCEEQRKLAEVIRNSQ